MALLTAWWALPQVGRHIEAIGLGPHAFAKLPYSGLKSKRTRAIVIYCGWFGPKEVILLNTLEISELPGISRDDLM
jgi:hypothetical protein